MTPPPFGEPDADSPIPPWKPAQALGWSVAASVVLAGSAKLGLALRGEPFEGVPALPWPAPEIGAGCGLGAAILVAVACGLSRRAATVLTLLAVAVGAAAAWAAAFLQPFRWAEPEDSFLAAFALVGLVAGFAGYALSRRFAVEAPDDEYAPHVLLPTPGLRVVLMALLFVVAAIVGAPSGVGWLVLAVGGFGLVVALALAGQERRIAELERRLRRLEDAQTGEAAGTASGSPRELD